MVRRRQPPSQTWRTFLRNHVGQIVAADFFVVPTATCRLLFVLILLAHDRRRIVHIAVTAHPTATWTGQQVRDAFPWDEAPRFLLHDRDSAFAGLTTAAVSMQDILTAPRSPWQNAYVERFIGSVRRECLDHVIIANATGLRRVLSTYVEYDTASRTHLALEKDAPLPRVCLRPPRAKSSRSLRSAVFTTGTNVALLSLVCGGFQRPGRDKQPSTHRQPARSLLRPQRPSTTPNSSSTKRSRRTNLHHDPTRFSVATGSRRTSR
jgi:transposase InsO family protein